MSRYLVPLVLVALISGLAFVLIIGIVARSPETHSNVYPEGYDRTLVSYVGNDVPFEGMGLATPNLVTDLDAAASGRLLFLGFSCATCHSLTSHGGVLGPDLDPGQLSPSAFRRKVRSGPEGMPAYIEGVLSAQVLEDLYAYLKATHEEASATPAENTGTR